MATFELYSYSASHRLMSLNAGISSKTYPMSVVVKNISLYTIKRLLMQIVVKKEELGYAESGKLVLANIVGSGTTPAAVTIDPGERKGTMGSVSARVTREMLSAMTAAGIRSAQVYVYTKATSASLGFPEEYIPIPNHFILNTYAAPVISDFSLARGTNGREDDEGINLLTTLKLGCAPDTLTSGMSIRLHYAQNADADANSPYIDLSAHVDALIAGVENAPDLISQTFSNGHDWGFYLTFGDEFESVSASAQIFKAFANMHLSGESVGGVCFGGFCSKSTDENGNPEARFECYYPAYFYGGIALGGMKDYSAAEQDIGTRWIDGKRIYRRLFTGTLKAATVTQLLTGIDYETVIRLDGMQHVSSSDSIRALNYYNSASNNARVYAQDGIVKAYSTAAGDVWGVIEYTKNGDEA